MIYVPSSLLDPTEDVLGNALQNKGRVKYPNELWSSCLSVDGSQVLTASDLTGITIVDYDAEGVMSINGNNIEITAGECYYLELSNGAKYRFSEYGETTLSSISGTAFDLEISGSLIDVWTLSPYAYPQNNSKGFSFGVGYYIPASELEPTKDVDGNDLEVYGTDTGLNGCESAYLTPYTYELIQACISLSPNFIFDDGESTLWGYGDIESNVQDLDLMFSDTETNAPVKDKVTIYSEALTGDCLTEAYAYFKIIN